MKFHLAFTILLILTPLTYVSLLQGEVMSSSYDYGYEFGYVHADGVEALITFYNTSLAYVSPYFSVQENVCLNLGVPAFVQNVISCSYTIEQYPNYSVNKTFTWETSIFFDGEYHITSHQVEGNRFNLTTTWINTNNGTLITFCESNFTDSNKVTCLVPLHFLAIIYPGYYAGTVISGYGNSATAYLGKGFNVSIQQFYRYHGEWFVPPVAFSGYPNTGESAVNGSAHFYDGKVWVTWGNEGIQELYNYSVVIVNDSVYTFPQNSLWFQNGKPFINNTNDCGEIAPFFYFNHSFSPQKRIQLRFARPTVVDGVKGETFYLPFPEYVYERENGSCIPLYVSSNMTFQSCQSSFLNKATSSTSSSTSLTQESNGLKLIKFSILIAFFIFNIVAIVLLKRKKV
ncbi:hypothetical protein RQ359_001252 [Sulfuracidifex metallicus DSM 6482 = JCM 9184]|nr:hypothetical protein RQ359_001252 [Sulfuracidifex metallicus DSM 6482 = JCM 9184]